MEIGAELIQEFKQYIQEDINIYDLYLQLFFVLKRTQFDVMDLVDQGADVYGTYCKLIQEILCESEFEIQLGEYNRKRLFDIFEQSIKEPLLILLAVFKMIDEVFGEERFVYSKKENENFMRVEKVDALNSYKTRDRGEVFRKIPSYLDRNYPEDWFIRQSDQIGVGIESFQTNLFVFTDMAPSYNKIVFEVYDQYTLDYFKDCNSLKIAMAPFTGEKSELIFEVQGNKTYLKTIKDEDDYIHRAITILEQFREQGIHVVIFPEMVFTEKIILHIRKYLLSNIGCFGLVIAGTIWNQRVNQCVMLNGEGIEISRQQKFNPYHQTIDFNKAGNNEGILLSTKEKQLGVYDVKYLGRVVTPICADFISEDCFELLKGIKVNMIFVPAFTPSLETFMTYANHLGVTNKAVSCICNCCIPVLGDVVAPVERTPHKISYAFVPFRKGVDRIQFETCNQCKQNCAEEKCYYSINFSKKACKFSQHEV